jgi:uncharacterized protein
VKNIPSFWSATRQTSSKAGIINQITRHQKMAPISIIVTGTSTIIRKAERATLIIDVSDSGPSQKEAVDHVTSTAKQLQSGFKLLAPTEGGTSTSSRPAITRWTMSSMSTGQWNVWLSGQSTTTYRASTTFEVRFADFEKLSAACADLSRMQHVAIRSLSWSLSDNTRAGLASESRRQAVADAVVKAQDFGKAFSKDKITPLEITDEKSMMAPQRMPPMAFGSAPTRSTAPAGTQAPETLSFEPEEVNINCSVRIRFEAE